MAKHRNEEHMLSLILGGSGSGKSEYAENLAVSHEKLPLVYIATMQPFDQEGKLRVEKHRKMRADKNFTTIERYINLETLEVPKNSVLLLECMSNLVANEMYAEGGAGADTVERIMDGILHLLKESEHFVIVTNNVFDDGMEYDPETHRYLSYLGEINQKLASIAEQVTESVHGIPVEWRKE